MLMSDFFLFFCPISYCGGENTSNSFKKSAKVLPKMFVLFFLYGTYYGFPNHILDAG